MNRGTKEGELEEKEFCINFNQRRLDLGNTSLINGDKVFAVHCTLHKYSNISEKLVKPKSDCFLIRDLSQQFTNNTKYINEKELKKGSFEYIPNSGISVKHRRSKSYQIHKFPFNTFMKVFNNKYIFIGLMIYCKYDHELKKNNKIFSDFGISEKEFINFFSLISSQTTLKEKLQTIKTDCVNKIKDTVSKNKDIWDIIYSGRGVFKDPFCASYFHQDKEIIPIDNLMSKGFSVTNGSGRSRGNYTLVIKP